MRVEHPHEHPLLRRMVERLRADLGPALASVVLYGSAARGDFHGRRSDFNLLLVLADLEPPTLERLTGAVRWWERQGQPIPRLFSPALIRETADVFPIELLDLRQFRVILDGSDPFVDLELHTDWLRLQCERELREKMMRLREAYVECHDRESDLRQLLTTSYTTFLALFRGCLYLLGGGTPAHNDEVVRAFCARAGLDPAPFAEVDRLKRGEHVDDEPRAIFYRYHAQLTRAVAAIERFGRAEGGDSHA